MANQIGHADGGHTVTLGTQPMSRSK